MNLGILENAGINTVELMNTLMDNRDILITVLDKFLVDKNYEEIRKAFAGEDSNLNYEAIEMYAHTLKGTSATLEMTELHLRLQKLVDDVRTEKYSILREDFENVAVEYDRIINAISEWKIAEEIS